MLNAIGNRGAPISSSHKLEGMSGMDSDLMIAEPSIEDLEAPRRGLVATLLVATTLVWSFTVVSSAAAF